MSVKIIIIFCTEQKQVIIYVINRRQNSAVGFNLKRRLFAMKRKLFLCRHDARKEVRQRLQKYYAQKVIEQESFRRAKCYIIMLSL